MMKKGRKRPEFSVIDQAISIDLQFPINAYWYQRWVRFYTRYTQWKITNSIFPLHKAEIRCGLREAWPPDTGPKALEWILQQPEMEGVIN